MLVAQIALIVVCHRILLPAAMRFGTLPTNGYSRQSLVLGAITHTPFVILCFAAFVPLVLRWNHIRWQDIDRNRRTRLFMMVPVFIFAWVCSLYDLNIFFGQVHLDGRLLTVLLAVACWFHPAFVSLFALWVAVVLGQIQAPIAWGDWHWADKRLPFDTLILFTAYLEVRAWSKTAKQLFAFLILTLTGATYAYAAYRKLILGPTLLSWPLENQFGNLFVGAYLNGGWLRGLSSGQILDIASVLNTISPLLGSATVLVEGAGLALLWHRRSTAPILFAIIGMHLMILLSSGIFFWKWILQNLALIGYIHLLNRDSRQDPRAKLHRVLLRMPSRLAIPASILLIVLAKPAFNTARFAWHDSPVTNYFEIRAQGVSGASYRMDPRFFAPYELIVQQSRFYYAIDRPVLAGTYASMYDQGLLDALHDASPDDFPTLRERFGSRYWDANATVRLIEFFKSSIEHARERRQRSHPLSWLATPYHFRTTMADDTYAFQEPITGISLRWQEWFYDGRNLHHIADEPVLQIAIEP